MRAHTEGKDDMGKRFAIRRSPSSARVIGGSGPSAQVKRPPTTSAAATTITADTTLDSDLVNCPTTGIVIGADNVTLDLNGHTIDGDGTIPSVGGGGGGYLEDFGVSIFNHDGITVKDGSIRQFGQGLSAFGARDIRLLGLAASQNHIGITVGAAARILIRDCSANHSGREGVGLLLSNARGPGIEHDGPARHVRVVDSSFRHNGEGIGPSAPRTA